MPVHNHGPEEGPGLACNELKIDDELVGTCLLETITNTQKMKYAAGLMRHRAEQATQGPWVTSNIISVKTMRGGGDTVVNAHIGQDFKQRANILHIASWGPEMAYAIADYLEKEADIRLSDEVCDKLLYNMPGMELSPPVVIARTFLGEHVL